MKWINRLYIFFLGIILSVTTGFGIAAFHPQPVQPTYPSSTVANNIVPQSCSQTPQSQQAPGCKEALAKEQQLQQQDQTKMDQYDKAQQIFQNKNASYNRTAIFLGIVIGALFAIVGLGLIKISKLVANGLLLAGILTAILTRLLISLASLGATTTGTAGADALSYLEFGVLLVLSIVIVGMGLFSLKETVVATTQLASPRTSKL